MIPPHHARPDARRSFDIEDCQVEVKQDRLDRYLKDLSLPTFGGAASTRVNAPEREELLPITQNGEKSMNGFGKAYPSPL